MFVAELPTNLTNTDPDYAAESALLATSISDAVKLTRIALQHNQSKLLFNDPNLEAKILVEHACQKTSVQLITCCDELLSNEQKHLLVTYIKRRIDGYPVAYIIKHQAFWTLDLVVSEDTLIPRADSELLVETAIRLPLASTAKIVDLGTGTGAIALAIKSERPHWQVMGTDFKAEIVELARTNAERNKLDAAFALSHWFSALGGLRFDLIISNPPYVETESEWLQKGDVRFEPDSALTSGLDGLDDIRHIVRSSIGFLKNDAYLMLEHGHLQAKDIQSLMNEAGFSKVQTKQDLNGLDRATIGHWDCAN
ncbi:MAG: release factor glutamine methyltransferase [Glaciecola sp.]